MNFSRAAGEIFTVHNALKPWSGLALGPHLCIFHLLFWIEIQSPGNVYQNVLETCNTSHAVRIFGAAKSVTKSFRAMDKHKNLDLYLTAVLVSMGLTLWFWAITGVGGSVHSA